MSIEGIIKKIEAVTEERIAEIVKEVNSNIAEIQSTVIDYETKVGKKADLLAKTESERVYRQTINRAEAEMRKETLAEKQELVREVFEKSYRKILALPPEELRKSYVGMLVNFGENEGEIIVGKDDTAVFDSNFDNMVRESMPESKFTKKSATDFDHGFMLISGKIQFDARAQSVFAQIEEELIDDVSKILFAPQSEG